MPTTRGARKAQSEDTQSPLRSLEDAEPKSRKKVSKAPKTLSTKVSDDKVTKRKSTVSKRSNKRFARGAKNSDTEDSTDEESVAPHQPSESVQSEQSELAQTGLQAVQEVPEDEEEDLKTQTKQEEIKTSEDADDSKEYTANGISANGHAAPGNISSEAALEGVRNADADNTVGNATDDGAVNKSQPDESLSASPQKERQTSAQTVEAFPPALIEPFHDPDPEFQQERMKAHETHPYVAPYIRPGDMGGEYLKILPRADLVQQTQHTAANAQQPSSMQTNQVEAPIEADTEDVHMEGQTSETTTQDETSGRSWLGRSIARVASTVSWLSPRKPLREASGAVLNTPNGARPSSGVSQSEPRLRRGRSRPLPGSSLGIHKTDSLSAERIRARHFQEDEIYRRKRELDLREEELNEKEEKMADELSEYRSQKRKRDLDDFPSRPRLGRSTYSMYDTSSNTGSGRSTYSMYDMSSSTEDDDVPSPPRDNASVFRAQFPGTPTRTIFGPSQTPTSILRKSGAEPPSKRLRTGSRSVGWKDQLEEDSPLQKHSPTNRIQYVPRTPYVRGSMFKDTEQVLKSAQKPGVSRSIYQVRNKFDKTPVNRPQGTVSPAAKTFRVPESSSSDEEEDNVPVTPSKTPSRNTEAAGSTPHPVKQTASYAPEPPATPQPAHATLPSSSHTPAGPPPLGNGIIPEASKSGPKTPSAGDEQQEQRLQKARESATPFTPKHPSRLRETETSATSQRTDPGTGALASAANQAAAPTFSMPPEVQSIIDAAWEGLDLDPEVLKDIKAAPPIPQSQLDAFQPSLYEEMLESKKEERVGDEVALDVDSQYRMMAENQESPLAKQRASQFEALTKAVLSKQGASRNTI